MFRYLAALATTALAAAPLMAAPPPYPTPASFASGSYKESCSGIHYKSDNPWVVIADCAKKKDYGERREYSYSSINFFGCDAGSIGNYDGKLQCTRSDAALMQHSALKNSQAVRSAAVIVMGTDPDWASLQRYYAYGWQNNPAFKTADLQFSDAALLLRDYLVKAASLDEVHAVEAAAYAQAFGKPHPSLGQSSGIVTWTYQDAIRSGKTWYAPLVSEMKKPKPAPTPTGPLPPIH